MMFNQWMLKGGGGGGGESGLEDEDDDGEMSYEVKVPPGSLRPPIKKGSAANSGLASNNFFLHVLRKGPSINDVYKILPIF